METNVPKTCKDPAHLEAMKTLEQINHTIADGIYLLSKSQLLLLTALELTRDVTSPEKETWEQEVRELLGSELSNGVGV